MIKLNTKTSGMLSSFKELTNGTFFVYPPRVRDCTDYYFIKISDTKAFSFGRRATEEFGSIDTEVYEIFDENVNIEINI